MYFWTVRVNVCHPVNESLSSAACTADLVLNSVQTLRLFVTVPPLQR